MLLAYIADPRRFASKRKLWRYGGLDVGENGRMRRRQKGVVAKWSGPIRMACLMPDMGIAAQIIRAGAAQPAKVTKRGAQLKAREAHTYRLRYEAKKAQLIATRGAGESAESRIGQTPEANCAPPLAPPAVDPRPAVEMVGVADDMSRYVRIHDGLAGTTPVHTEPV